MPTLVTLLEIFLLFNQTMVLFCLILKSTNPSGVDPLDLRECGRHILHADELSRKLGIFR